MTRPITFARFAAFLGSAMAIGFDKAEADAPHFISASPDGNRFAVEDMQTGKNVASNREGGIVIRLKSGMSTAPYAVATPWVGNSNKLLAAKRGIGASDALYIADLNTGRFRSVELPCNLVGAPATASSDGTVIAAGCNPQSQISSSLVLWYVGKPRNKGVFVVPYRFSVERVSWRNPDLLFVVTRGIDLGKVSKVVREEWFELNVRTLNSRPIGAMPSYLTRWVSPWPDCKGRTLALLTKAGYTTLVDVGGGTDTAATVAELPGGNAAWQAVRANAERLLLWHSAGRSMVEIGWFDCFTGRLGGLRSLPVQGPITVDAAGRIWSLHGTEFRALNTSGPARKEPGTVRTHL